MYNLSKNAGAPAGRNVGRTKHPIPFGTPLGVRCEQNQRNV